MLLRATAISCSNQPGLCGSVCVWFGSPVLATPEGLLDHVAELLGTEDTVGHKRGGGHGQQPAPSRE
eukprot:scaffold17690_cov119-Isochrysis_galbana.AAC.2